MFDRYFKAEVVFQIVGDISQRLGHFLWKGMKPFPALGTLFAKAAQGIQVFATFAAWREKISREEGSRKGAEIAKKCTIHVRICTLK